MENGKRNITTPAEKILSEAICAHVSSSLLAFISINELPQIMHNKINIPQLTNRSFLITMGKGQQSVGERKYFFIARVTRSSKLCYIQYTIMGKISLKDIVQKRQKILVKKTQRKKPVKYWISWMIFKIFCMPKENIRCLSYYREWMQVARMV